VLALVEAFLGQKVLEGAQEWTPEQGTPRGAVFSPLLSDIGHDPVRTRLVDARAEGFDFRGYHFAAGLR